MKKRLLRKFSFKEGTDCHFNFSGDESGGMLELVVDDQTQKRHKGYWCMSNGNADYFLNKNKNPNIIAFIQWTNYKVKNNIEIFIEFVEVMQPYRGGEAFKLIMNKFKEIGVDNLVNKYGEDRIYIDAQFDNPDFESYLRINSKEKLGVYLKEDFLELINN